MSHWSYMEEPRDVVAWDLKLASIENEVEQAMIRREQAKQSGPFPR